MKLAPEQRERVDKIVHAETPAEAVRLVVSIRSPEELHAVMLKYNWDDGFEMPMAVLDHPECERATASLIFINAQGLTDMATAKGKHSVLLRRVADLLLSGGLPELRIAYRPQINSAELYHLQKAGIPADLYRPSGPR
jgi:hypothetical protein